MREIFAIDSLDNRLKFSKTQLFKIVQSGEFIFGPPLPDIFDPNKGLMSLTSSVAKE